MSTRNTYELYVIGYLDTETDSSPGGDLGWHLYRYLTHMNSIGQNRRTGFGLKYALIFEDISQARRIKEDMNGPYGVISLDVAIQNELDHNHKIKY